jgi:hypothetical protein
MVATLEEAFGTRTLRRKSCKKDLKETDYRFNNSTNVYHEKYFDDNVNINSNDIQYQPKSSHPSRNKIPRILLDNSSEPIKLANIPIDMSGTGTLDDGNYSLAPGSDAEQQFFNPKRELSNPSKLNQYIDEVGEEMEDEMDGPIEEGMIDYQTFEQGVKKSIEDLSNKINMLLSNRDSLTYPLSNSADVILYIFTGIFFLFLFDMAVKIGKMRR